MSVCTVEGCKKEHSSHGYCQAHYAKVKRYSNPHGGKEYERHGRENTREYAIWCGIKTRCSNPKASYYADYGGRGIKVCDRWLHSFSNFYNDMGKAPSEYHSIDRRDVDGDYTPINCSWATPQEQALNHRVQRNNTSGYRGITFNKDKGSWRVLLRDKTIGLKIYFGSYKTPQEAAYVRDQVMMQYHEGKPIPLNFEYY